MSSPLPSLPKEAKGSVVKRVRGAVSLFFQKSKKSKEDKEEKEGKEGKEGKEEAV